MSAWMKRELDLIERLVDSVPASSSQAVRARRPGGSKSRDRAGWYSLPKVTASPQEGEPCDAMVPT